jgi:glycosyltransferase involved in cell wall biosynthesis
MIIGQFCEIYPPHIDGVGMVVRSYAEELSKTQEACYYIAPRNSEKRFPNSIDSFPVIKFASVPLPKEAYRIGLPRLDLTFQKDLKKIRFDIVHAHTPFIAANESLRIAKERKIPLVATLHSKYYDDILKKTHSETIAKAVIGRVVAFYNKCDEVWTVSEASAEVLRGCGYRGEIIVMENGTNLWYPSREDVLAAEMHFDLGHKEVFLFVGQQNFKKNLGNIMEAAAIYKRTHNRFKLVFVGQGPDTDKIIARSRALGLEDNMVFTGHISDREILKGLYARADLFLFPSLYDTAGLVVREAAAAGTPSLLIENSCAAEGITDGENGFLCKNTPEDICACMERALKTAKEVGARARETIPKPWSEIVKNVAERYEALIEKKKFENANHR